jgi:hypothetical protein
MTETKHSEKDEVYLSLGKSFVRVLSGLVALLMAAIAFFISFVVVSGWADGDIHWAVALVVAPLAFLFGLASLALAAYLCVDTIRALARRERLVLGKDALLCVVGEGDVLDRVPYDNIQDMRVVERQEETGPPYKLIGITLLDPRRADTVIQLNSHLAPADEDDEFDVTIQDLYKLSPEKLHKRLTSKWRKRLQQSYQEGGLPPDADLR